MLQKVKSSARKGTLVGQDMQNAMLRILTAIEVKGGMGTTVKNETRGKGLILEIQAMDEKGRDVAMSQLSSEEFAKTANKAFEHAALLAKDPGKVVRDLATRLRTKHEESKMDRHTHVLTLTAMAMTFASVERIKKTNGGNSGASSASGASSSNSAKTTDVYEEETPQFSLFGDDEDDKIL